MCTRKIEKIFVTWYVYQKKKISSQAKAATEEIVVADNIENRGSQELEG